MGGDAADLESADDFDLAGGVVDFQCLAVRQRQRKRDLAFLMRDQPADVDFPFADLFKSGA